MNIQYKFISGVLQQRAYNETIKLGIQDKMFQGKERIYWGLLKDHYEEFGQVPTPEYFKELAPAYEHVPPVDSLEALAHEIKTQYLAENLGRGLSEVSKLLMKDPWSAMQAMNSLNTKLMLESQDNKTTYIVGQESEKYVDGLKTLQQKGGIDGMHFPWEKLTRESGGIKPGQVFYIYGWQKSKKTWINLFLAYHFWKQGYKVLWFNREMNIEGELDHRIASLILRCPFVGGTPNQGDLSEGQFTFLKEEMDALYESDRWRIEDVFGGIGAIRAKIEEYSPDIVIHDYFQAIVEDSVSGKGSYNLGNMIANATNELVNLAKSLKIPVFFTGHVNREASNDGRSKKEHAGSAQITRRVDAAFRIISSMDEKRLAFIVNTGRSIREGFSFTMSGELCTTFGDYLFEDTSWTEHDSIDSGEELERGKGQEKSAKAAEKLIDNFSADNFL